MLRSKNVHCCFNIKCDNEIYNKKNTKKPQKSDVGWWATYPIITWGLGGSKNFFSVKAFHAETSCSSVIPRPWENAMKGSSRSGWTTNLPSNAFETYSFLSRESHTVTGDVFSAPCQVAEPTDSNAYRPQDMVHKVPFFWFFLTVQWTFEKPCICLLCHQPTFSLYIQGKPWLSRAHMCSGTSQWLITHVKVSAAWSYQCNDHLKEKTCETCENAVCTSGERCKRVDDSECTYVCCQSEKLGGR